MIEMCALLTSLEHSPDALNSRVGRAPRKIHTEVTEVVVSYLYVKITADSQRRWGVKARTCGSVGGQKWKSKTSQSHSRRDLIGGPHTNGGKSHYFRQSTRIQHSHLIKGLRRWKPRPESLRGLRFRLSVSKTQAPLSRPSQTQPDPRVSCFEV